MAPSSFRSAAVVCSIVTVTLGIGLLTPLTATAATSTGESATTPAPVAAVDAVNPDFDAIPVDPSLRPPQLISDWNTAYGSRVVAGYADGDAVWLVIGNTVYDHWAGSGVFFLNVQDRHKDQQLEVIKVHTAADGTQTQSERIVMPHALQVTGLQDKNTFTPGTNHFSGTATAGATIVATDTRSGKELFTSTASGARSGVGTWDADATLAADTDYSVTFTQTTPDGRKNGIRDITFAPSKSDAPAAPSLQTTERRLDGSFVLTGAPVAEGESVVIEDEAGAVIRTATLTGSGWVAFLPQERIGSTVYAVTRSEAGASSVRTAAPLTQLPTDQAVPKPSLRSVYVHIDGDVQVVGERDDAAALWVLDGDRVVGGVGHSEAWSYVIRAQHTGKQLDIVNLGFDGQGFSSMSERVPLPRLLEVDDLADVNAYTPGTRAFSGKAEAGATVTATDEQGERLFSTKATGARSGVGSWSTTADLSSTDGYDVTFTQTTADGRTSVMRNIVFDAEAQSALPVTVATKSITAGINNTFTGTATPGATLRVLNANGTQIVPGTIQVATNGTWTFDRVVSKGATKLDFVIEQTVNGTPTKSNLFSITASATAPVTVATKSITAGINNTFTGTATPGATLRVLNANGTQIVPGTIQVATNGTWTFDRVVSKGATKLDFVIEQTVNGTPTKSNLFSITASATAPVTVATRSITAGINNTFTGTATPGATLRVLNANGTQIVPGTIQVATNGTWTFDRVVSKGATKLDFVIEQTVNGTPTKSNLFSITASATAPVTVATKSITAGINNTFTGTATPGATLRVLNANGTQIVPGTIQVATNGTWTFDRVVSKGATKLDFVIEQTVNGTPTKSNLFSITAS